MPFPTITSVVLTRYYVDLVGQTITAYANVTYDSGAVEERMFSRLPASATAAADVATACQTAASMSPITVYAPPPPPAAVASIDLTDALAKTVKVGNTDQMTAVPKDAAGNALTGRVVTYSSSDPTIGTVDASGLVTGVAAGSVTITATCEGITATDTITVTP